MVWSGRIYPLMKHFNLKFPLTSPLSITRSPISDLYSNYIRYYRRNLIHYVWILFQSRRLLPDFWPTTNLLLVGDSSISLWWRTIPSIYINFWFQNVILEHKFSDYFVLKIGELRGFWVSRAEPPQVIDYQIVEEALNFY